MTIEELVLYVARGLTFAGAWTLFLTLFDFLPEKRVFAWVAWSAVVLVSASLWAGLA